MGIVEDISWGHPFSSSWNNAIPKDSILATDDWLRCSHLALDKSIIFFAIRTRTRDTKSPGRGSMGVGWELGGVGVGWEC